jgi:hypothetical protein
LKISLSDIEPSYTSETKDIAPEGVINANQHFACAVILVRRVHVSLLFIVSWCLRKEFCSVEYNTYVFELSKTLW